MSDLLELVSLQAIDVELDEARGRLAAIEEQLADSEDLEEARTRHEAAAEQLADLQKRQRALDGNVQDLAARIEREEKQLYDGSIKQFKELQVLETDVEHLRQERATLDEEVLKLLNELEQATAALAAIDEQVTALSADWTARSAGLEGEANDLRARVAKVEAVRSAQVEQVTAGGIRLYEALRRRKGGRAVVRMQGSSCLGCRVAVPDAIRRRVMNSPTLVQCPQCERILTMG